MVLLPDFPACYAADTSGVDDGSEPISIAVTLLARRFDGTYSPVAIFDGLQEPINSISARATEIHQLRNADVAGKEFALGRLEAMLSKADTIFSWHPDFDRKMLGRLTSDASTYPWRTMRIDEKLHDPAPVTAVGGRTRARMRVDHMVGCITKPLNPPEGQLWLNLLMNMPAIPPEQPEPEYVVDGNVKVARVFHRNLGRVRVGDQFQLWTNPEIDFIAGYQRNIGGGGGGLCFHLLKSENRKIARLMQHGSLKGYLVEADGLRRRIEIDLD